jgi:hypothetical protein
VIGKNPIAIEKKPIVGNPIARAAEKTHSNPNHDWKSPTAIGLLLIGIGFCITDDQGKAIAIGISVSQACGVFKLKGEHHKCKRKTGDVLPWQSIVGSTIMVWLRDWKMQIG